MSLPLILAGPILRRVEPRLASVWLAFSSSQQNIEWQIWDNSSVRVGNAGGVLGVAHTATGATIQIAPALHIACVTLKIPEPALPLLPEKIYSYNIVLGGTKDLLSEGFLTDKLDESTDTATIRKQRALGYSNGILPTFMLPRMQLKDLKIAHGSCRKIHGFGTDALAALDILMGKVNNDITARPQQLFLTGDQIYADDLPALLLPELVNSAKTQIFTGLTEQIKLTNDLTVPADIDHFPSMLRQGLIRQTAGMSSDDASCHAISFQEYCTLYLHYWSNAIWSDTLMRINNEIGDDNHDDALDELVDGPKSGDPPGVLWPGGAFKSIKDQIDHSLLDETMKPLLLTDDTSKHTKELNDLWGPAPDGDAVKKAKKGMKQEIKDLVAFRESLPRVSRVLANIPVYMICDDHEITDDWNISARWRQRTIDKPLGRTIIRNGLMAYSIFQAWGNDPLSFDPASGAADAYKTALQAKIPLFVTAPNDALLGDIDTLLGLADATQDTQIAWNYSVQCGPTQVCVLDTRNHRGFSSADGPPALMKDTAMAAQLPAGNQIGAGADVLFIVSPAPVLNWAIMEELISPLYALGEGLFKASGNIVQGSVMADREMWGLDVPAFEKFLAALEKYKKVVLLSGDFHYGYSVALDYWKNGPGTATPPARIVQLVSSGFKNGFFVEESLLVSGRIQQLTEGFMPAERLGWSDGKHVTIGGNGKINPHNAIRLRKRPVVLSPLGWIPGATTSPATPDWTWRLHNVGDDRPDGDGNGNTRPIALLGLNGFTGGDMGAQPPAAAYIDVVKVHQQFLENNIGRQVVWASNVGVISLDDTSGKLTMKHNLLYQVGDDSRNTDFYTVHSISLEPTTDAQPRPLN